MNVFMNLKGVAAAVQMYWLYKQFISSVLETIYAESS